MSDALETAMGWRDAIDNAHDKLVDEVRAVKEAQLEDVMSMIEDVDTALEGLQDAIPCSDGVQEFVDGLGVDLDEYYHSDDVALTHGGLTDSWDWHYNESALELVKFDDMASLLDEILSMDRYWKSRAMLRSLVSDLKDGTYATQSHDAAYYEEAV